MIPAVYLTTLLFNDTVEMKEKTSSYVCGFIVLSTRAQLMIPFYSRPGLPMMFQAAIFELAAPTDNHIYQSVSCPKYFSLVFIEWILFMIVLVRGHCLTLRNVCSICMSFFFF